MAKDKKQVKSGRLIGCLRIRTANEVMQDSKKEREMIIPDAETLLLVHRSIKPTDNLNTK